MTALASQPCDEWPWAWPANGYRIPADRSQPETVEGFDPRMKAVLPVLAKFLPYVKTDFHHWSDRLDWTLESGPDEAPSCIEIEVPYSYYGGCNDYFAFGCWNPGDPPEVECGQPWFVNEDGQRCEVSLLPDVWERIETYIYENPPEPDYGDDY